MNKDMRLLLVAMLVVAVVSVATFSFLPNHINNDDGDEIPDEEEISPWPISVKDLNGHDVTITNKIERVAVTDLSTLEIFATAYGDGWEDVVCTMPADTSSKDPSLGSYISKTWPNLTSLPTIPELGSALASDPHSVAEVIIDAKPDLVILPKAVVDGVIDPLDGFYTELDQAGIPYFHTMFGIFSFTSTVAKNNIGQLCKLFQNDKRGDEIVFFYDFAHLVVKNRLAAKADIIRFYVEVPSSPSEYGNVTASGFPEIDFLGYNIQNDYGGGDDHEFSLEKMVECDADWILLYGVPCYDGKQLLGYCVDEDDEALAACMTQYLAREGWSDLDAVKSKHVCFCYGEHRHGIGGIYDLYKLANLIDETIVTDDELASVIVHLDKYLPWGFEGTFTYVMERS